MERGVVRRVLGGLGANAYNQAITVVIQLVGVPLLLHAWGSQLYGEWLLLYAIPSYLSMTDLGFSQSAANDMTARVFRGDYDGALAVFQTLLVLLLVLVCSVALFAPIVAQQLPLNEWLHFEAMDAKSARWVLCLLIAELLLRLFDEATHAGFRANGDYAFHLGLVGTTRLLQSGVLWSIALIGGGAVLAAGGYALTRLISSLGVAFWLLHRHSWLRSPVRYASVVEVKRLAKPALANMAVPLSRVLNIQGMVLIVGAVLGPIAVVAFSTMRTLTRVTLQLVLSVGQATEPELAAAWGTNRRDLMRTLFTHGLRGGLWLALIAACALMAFGEQILEIWTRGKISMQPALFGWLLCSGLMTVLWFGALTVLKAANRHLRAAVVMVLASVLGLGIAALGLNSTRELAFAGVSLVVVDLLIAGYVLHSASSLLRIPLLGSLLCAANPLPLVSLARRMRA